VFFLEQSGWRKLEVDNFKLDLPAETLLSRELVSEMRGEARAQRSASKCCM